MRVRAQDDDDRARSGPRVDTLSTTLPKSQWVRRDGLRVLQARGARPLRSGTFFHGARRSKLAALLNAATLITINPVNDLERARLL